MGKRIACAGCDVLRSLWRVRLTVGKCTACAGCFVLRLRRVRLSEGKSTACAACVALRLLRGVCLSEVVRVLRGVAADRGHSLTLHSGSRSVGLQVRVGVGNTAAQEAQR